MTREEYENLINEEHKRHANEVIAIRRKFALDNNPYKIGDKIRDCCEFIEISKITISVFADPPNCVYHGYLLRKDGTKMKYGRMSRICQSDIKKI